MKSARLAAFELIYDVFSNNAYSNLQIESSIKDVNEKDKQLFSALALGVIERKITLDYIISPYLRSRAKPKVMVLLYLGTYQLYFMDKIPPSAAINEAVELAKEVGCEYYTKLINAVLHKVDNNRIDLEKTDDLCVKYSCPPDLINMWKKHYGEENTEKILRTINTTAPVFAVPNTLYADADELAYELMCDNIECEAQGELVRIFSSFDVKKSRAYENGLFHIEDLSSYNCAKALDAREGDTVIDFCSAPGGKAFTIAEQMNNIGEVYAYDLHKNRVSLIQQGADRLGLSIIKADINDASVYNENIHSADRILCDVPCSGFGIIRRKPEIRYKSLDNVKDLPELQYKILSASSKHLKDNGKLVYSTCTLNVKENERVVQRFLNENKEYSLIEEKTVFPENDGGDGFYYAVLQKI